jgi:rifampicin phosphotransferase
MTLIISFPGTEQTTLDEVGCKGYSLIRMIETDLPVPPGVILPTSFFNPWFDEIQSSSIWGELAGGTPEKWDILCPKLQELCPDLRLTTAQRQALDDVRVHFSAIGDHVLLAVRSSSPEEDQASASFAGGYETKLGVPVDRIEQALRFCFASALDERVFHYKREHGFDVLTPRLAVVIQEMIASEVAGVGFSLNPLTNDYDEAVIDANWGFGESVVAGRVTPDHFVLDKVTGKLIQKELGAKQISIWLDPAGGIVEKEAYKSLELTLNEAQLGEIEAMLCRIETLFGNPVDIEWAYADGRLYILQARPITTYVPLPPEMVTKPGDRRRLYSDAGLSQGLVINQPISPLGLSWMQDMLYSSLLKKLIGIEDFTPEGGLVFSAGSRFYLNLSNMMWLGMTPRGMAKNNASYDALIAEILANIDAKKYRARRRPSWVRPRLLLSIPGAIWMMRGFLWRPLAAFLRPERTQRTYQREVGILAAALTYDVDFELPLDEFARKYTQLTIASWFNITIPTLVAGLVSPNFMILGRSYELRKLAEKLRWGLTGNLVVEQGIALFRLARLLENQDFNDLSALAERIEKRQMSEEFLNEWDAFLEQFGCRGPHEMDVASQRYADDPTLALQQMSYMRPGDGGFDPEAAHRINVEERQRAYDELLRRWRGPRRALLRRIYQLIHLFGGTRDTPKHHAVMLIALIRKRALIEGKRLMDEGRLDLPEDVFSLTFDDLKAALRDPALDLGRLCRERTRFGKQLAEQVTDFPQVIDSRGRILRPPPREGNPGELKGMAVSPGVVTGPVKVMRSPRDKPVEKGDVLVAYTTDPGWTPLFVNAAAVVLEVGGVLQHGAVIAREYGKPCVVGIDRVMTRLEDGQKVEVDGTNGIIRLL